jgi:hypothetical protein
MSSGGTAQVTSAKWMNVKFGGGGQVQGRIFHPTSPHVLYARTGVGGACRWNAASSAWMPIIGPPRASIAAWIAWPSIPTMTSWSA